MERLHRTLDEEFYRKNFFTTPDELDEGMEAYLRYYNGDRIHLGIRGLTPDEKHAEMLAGEMKTEMEPGREVMPSSRVA